VLLSKYKKRMKYNVTDLAEQFGTSHQNMYKWIKAGADIKGKTGERVITLTKVLAEEQAIEVVK
jgi:transposase-like protein